MHRELLWFLCPLSSLLWAAGGTWAHDFRRLGIPLLLLFSVVLFKRLSLGWLLAIAALAGTLRLPITLIGDSIPGNWVNWLWLPVLGFLWGVYPVFVDWRRSLVPACMVSILFCVPTILSNIPQLAVIVEWKLVEVITGFAVAVPAAYILRHKED